MFTVSAAICCWNIRRRAARYNDKQTTGRIVCDSSIALSKVYFAIISAAFSYFSLYKLYITKYSDAMNNNHISQFSQFFTRARTPAGVVGWKTYYCDRSTALSCLQGQTGTYFMTLLWP